MLRERLGPSVGSLVECGVTVEIVRGWDADQIDCEQITMTSRENWARKISLIYPILMANAISSKEGAAAFAKALAIYDKKPFNNQDIPKWMAPRALKPGEVSVLFKHFYALAGIAHGHDLYGIVAEDDILSNAKTNSLFSDAVSAAYSLNYDYIDLAGGANLHPEKLINTETTTKNVVDISPARTRTNACYLISRRYARLVVNRFFPLAFPIDWHLQHIFATCPPLRCGWSIEAPFIHGSELGAYRSWQS